jgi:hypothetical protein
MCGIAEDAKNLDDQLSISYVCFLTDWKQAASFSPFALWKQPFSAFPLGITERP